MRNKGNFNVIDLFAGCGGLSEGFKQAGLEISAQIEMDEWACETLKTRQLYYELKNNGKIYYYHKYLRNEIKKEDLLKKFPDIKRRIEARVIQARFGYNSFNSIKKCIEKSKDLNEVERFNVLLGGPPCQPYSLMGRSRDPDRMEKDSRHYLYEHYLKILEYIKPDFFIYENVPGLFSAKASGESIFQKILDDFSELNPQYEIIPPLIKVKEKPTSYILDSANFGVPQHRKRLILIGFKKTLKNKMPGVEELFFLLQKKEPEKNRKSKCLNVRDAVGDLPDLKPGKGNDSWYGYYDNNTELTEYQRRMRKNSQGIINHKARTHMKSDIERYKFFVEHSNNGNLRVNLKNLLEERPDIAPNHKHQDKFLDRFKVQWWDKPSSTITAHISKDGHYYIHPDINQCRSFTVREAARCQSFPDNFMFEGPRTEQFKQVGNAVPPILAREIAKLIKKQLENIYEHSEK